MQAGTVQSLTFVADNTGHLLDSLVHESPQVMSVPGGVIHSRGAGAAMAYAQLARGGAMSPASATSDIDVPCVGLGVAASSL
jgi:hypothetical protein